MLFLTSYKFKGDQSPDSVKEMLALFAERGPSAGEVAHYVASDGRGGLLVTEADSMADGYEGTLAFARWMDFTTTPVMTIEDAMPIIMGVHG